jgi:protein-disulfide isomerase
MMPMFRKDRMFRSLSLFAILFVVTFTLAQEKPASAAKPATAKPAPGASSTPLPSEETVNAFLKATFGYQPQVTWKVADIKPSKAKGLAEVDVVLSNPQGKQQSVFYVSGDGAHALVGEIIPFGPHPFEADRKELAAKATGPLRGPADSPVTIVEFSDMQCPHCKAVQPVIEKLLTDEPNAKLVYQNFPLPMHDWAAKAAAYNNCVAKQSKDAFWKFVASVYDQQAEITATSADEKLTALADQAGVKGADAAACAAHDDTVGHVQGEVLLGQSLNVNATPTLFINGRRIADLGSLPYEVLKSLVEFAAKGN